MISYHSGDIFDSNCNIICHEVDCLGGDFDVKFKRKCHDSFNRYINFVKRFKKEPMKLLGRCCTGVFDDNEDRWVANLFGYFDSGNNTDVEALEKSLLDCKNFAEVCDYSIAIPFGIGHGTNWVTEVRPMIERVFRDFPNEVEIWSDNNGANAPSITE